MRPIVDKKSPVRQGSPDRSPDKEANTASTPDRKKQSTPSPGTALSTDPGAKGDPSPGSARHPRNPRNTRESVELVDYEEQVKPEFQGRSGYDKAQKHVTDYLKTTPEGKKGQENKKRIEREMSKMEAVEPDGGGSAPQVPAPVAQFVDDLPKNAKKVVKKIKRMVTGEAVEGPALPGEPGRKGTPKAPGGRPHLPGEKQTPAPKKRVSLQLAGHEPEGDQLDEIAPALAAGAALGIGAAGLGLINKLRNQKKDMDAGKKVGGPMGAIQRRNEALKKAAGQ